MKQIFSPRTPSLVMTLLIMRGLHLKKLAKKYRQTHTERMAVNGQPPLLESEKNTAFQLFENMQHSCWRENIFL